MSVLFNVDFLDSEQRIFFASMAIFLSRISGDMFPRCDSSHLCNCWLYFERKWTNSRKFPRLLNVCDSSCPRKARPCFDRKSAQSNGLLAFSFPCDSCPALLVHWVVRAQWGWLLKTHSHDASPATTDAFCCQRACEIHWSDPEISSSSCNQFQRIQVPNSQLQPSRLKYQQLTTT